MGCSSSVGRVSASQAAVSRSTLAPSNSCMENFPLPLIQEEQVVSYLRKYGHLMLVNCLREACIGTVTDHPYMISAVHHGCKAPNQTNQKPLSKSNIAVYLSHVMRKPTFWFPTWSDTNQAVQLQKKARVLKFGFRK